MTENPYKYLIPGFEERLKSFFGVKRAQELAQLLGENNNTFNHYLTGRSKVPVDLLLKIHHLSKQSDVGPINLTWLLTGEGSMSMIERVGVERLTGHKKRIVQDFLISQLLQLGTYESESIDSEAINVKEDSPKYSRKA